MPLRTALDAGSGILLPVFGFAEDTHARHNQTIVCFCTRLLVSLQKILMLGKMQVYLHLLSLIRTFDTVLDTPALGMLK